MAGGPNSLLSRDLFGVPLGAHWLSGGGAGVATAALQPGSYVELRAERDVIAVLSNCPQMHNPCNGYKPTPIGVTIFQPVTAA